MQRELHEKSSRRRKSKTRVRFGLRTVFNETLQGLCTLQNNTHPGKCIFRLHFSGKRESRGFCLALSPSFEEEMTMEILHQLLIKIKIK